MGYLRRCVLFSLGKSLPTQNDSKREHDTIDGANHRIHEADEFGTISAGTAAGYSGFAEFRLVRVAHGPVHSTATEGQVAQWLVARIKPEGQKGSGSGQIIPDILSSTPSGPAKAVQNRSGRFCQPEIQGVE